MLTTKYLQAILCKPQSNNQNPKHTPNADH